MAYKLIYSVQDITHSGSHIGRELEVDIKTSENISLNFRKRVLPDRTTKLDKEFGSVVTEREIFSLLLDVTLTEHDVLFNDVGNIKQDITFNINQNIAKTDTLTVPVTERRWFFWKKKAYFTLTVVTKLESIPELKRVPTVDDPKWTGDFNDDTVQMILARALFGEARDTLIPDEARYAIASVIKNRVADSRWPGSYAEVITAPKQFSAFNDGNVNRSFVENPLHTGNSIDAKAWRHAYAIAEKVLRGTVADPTDGANHYHDDSIDAPPWAKDRKPTLTVPYANQLGRSVNVYFFRL